MNTADSLPSKLREVADLLKTHNERQWAFRLEGDLERLLEGDLSTLEHLLSAYGGMGSLSDLYLCPENGHKSSSTEQQQVNLKLQRLTIENWQLAKDRVRWGSFPDAKN